VKASDLTMICPSRGRPANIAELATCWEQTGALAHLLVVVDDDDPALEQYLALPELAAGSDDDSSPMLPPISLEVIEEPRRLGPILNSIVPAVAQHGGAVGFLGDDHRPRTAAWDQRLVDALPGVAYGNDMFQEGKLPTAVAMSAGIVQALGYFTPPGVEHLYLDDFWLTLGRELGAITYLPDVIIEHVHPHAGKAAWDEGYSRVNSIQQYNADSNAYQRFMTGQWPDDLRRLRAQGWQG